MFNKSKYTNWYYQIIEQAKNRVLAKPIYSEKHHILPKSLGGDQSKTNLVRLLPREHFVCHKLLIKMVTGQAKYKMLEAVAIFSNNKKRNLRLNSRDIAIIREANAVASSQRNIGNQHYLARPPASAKIKSIRSKNASNSRWVNNGVDERFTTEHFAFIEKSNYTYGRLPFDKEWLEKIRPVPGQVRTEDTKKKISNGLKNKPKSEEHKKKISDTRKSEPAIVCDHCGFSTNRLNHNKWHGSNCKHIRQA